MTCRGVFVLPGVQLDVLDLGLVEPGTQCGPSMVSPAPPGPSLMLESCAGNITPPNCPVHTLPIGVPGQALPKHYLLGAGAMPGSLPWPWGECQKVDGGRWLGVTDPMGSSFSLLLCRFATVTKTATALRAGLRPPATSQGLVAVWTVALCSLKVCPWGTSGEGWDGAPAKDSALPCCPQTTRPSCWH